MGKSITMLAQSQFFGKKSTFFRQIKGKKLFHKELKSNSVLLLNNVDLIDLNHSLDAVENWGRHRYVHN